jgi:hypothetical protein
MKFLVNSTNRNQFRREKREKSEERGEGRGGREREGRRTGQLLDVVF